MIRMVRQSAFAALAAALALALLPNLAVPGAAAPAAQAQARIAVAVFPDLVGDGAGEQGCPGCDGEYTAEDTAANADDPLPSLEVVLRDADGDEIERNTTSGLANGRQVTFFSVEEAGAYTIEVTGLPEAWEACPDGSLTMDLTADDFDELTGFATVDVYVWRGCEADESAMAMSEEEEEPTETVTTTETTAVTTEPTVAVTTTAEVTPTVPATAEPTEAPTRRPTATEPPTAVPEQPTAAPTEETLFGAIRGVVFEDANENGRLDAGEYGVPDVTLRLVGLAASETTTTAGAGTYAFAELAAGSYDVYLDVPDGAELTTPDRYVGIAVDGGVVMGIDFGLTLAKGTVAPTPEPTAETPALPSTGVQLQPRGRSLIALAVAVGLLGALGLALETRLGRRSLITGKEGEDA